MIEDLYTYLISEGIGTSANIFISELPFDKSDIIALHASPSPDPDKAIKYYFQTVDITARFSKYIDGYNKLKSIFDLLHTKAHYEMGDKHIYLSSALGMIMDNDRDVQRRHLLQLTLAFIYRINEDFS
jgi:hypothetical protein